MLRLPSRPSSDAPRRCELPLGLMERGKRQCRVELRRFEGNLQLRLLDLDVAQPRERALSQALSLCVERIGSVRDPTPEIMGRLTLSDRHALVRSLLLAHDNRVLAATVDCPGCAHRLEMTLDLSAVKLPRIPASGRLVLTRRRKGRVLRSHLRLPSPADLEQADDDTGLLGLCLGCTPAAARPWLGIAEKALSDYDPLGSVEIVGRCPECSGEVRAEFDLVATWLSRLKRIAGTLLEDIHMMALRYHWTEDEILRIPGNRRREYLDLCWGTPPEPMEI